MKLLLNIGLILFMFLSTSVANKIGVDQVGFFSSFIIILLFFRKIINVEPDKLYARYKNELIIILIALTIILLKNFGNDLSGIKHVIFFLLVPMAFSILLKHKPNDIRKNIQKIVLFFYLAQCFLSIFEKIYSLNIFPYVSEFSDSIVVQEWDFRSTAFLGHPLANALVVSIIMGFILTSTIRPLNKFILILIGFVSLLSFNARGAIIIWCLLTTFYLYYLIKIQKIKFGIPLIIVAALFITYFINILIVDYGFGGRIIRSEIFDGSALTRVEVFNAFNYISNYDFWFGNTANYIPVMEKLEAGGIENSFIVIILNYGIVMSLILFVAYFIWIRRYLKAYSSFNKFVIFFSFILVGSTNNGLASPVPWIFFIICINTFSFKRNLQVMVYKKYIFQKF